MLVEVHVVSQVRLSMVKYLEISSKIILSLQKERLSNDKKLYFMNKYYFILFSFGSSQNIFPDNKLVSTVITAYETILRVISVTFTNIISPSISSMRVRGFSTLEGVITPGIIPFLVFYTHLRLIDPSFFLSFS